MGKPVTPLGTSVLLFIQPSTHSLCLFFCLVMTASPHTPVPMNPIEKGRCCTQRPIPRLRNIVAPSNSFTVRSRDSRPPSVLCTWLKRPFALSPYRWSLLSFPEGSYTQANPPVAWWLMGD